MSSAYPPHSQGYNPNASSVDDLISSASARQPDDIDELIRMAEAGIKPPKKSDAPPGRTWAPPPAQPLPASAPPQVANTTVSLPIEGALEPDPLPVPEVSDKKSTKKDKEKNAKMVYSDNEVSPEEKMAKLNRYAFVPDGKDDTVLADVVEPVVSGVIDEQIAD
jgi:hypothetical protein